MNIEQPFELLLQAGQTYQQTALQVEQLLNSQVQLAEALKEQVDSRRLPNHLREKLELEYSAKNAYNLLDRLYEAQQRSYSSAADRVNAMKSIVLSWLYQVKIADTVLVIWETIAEDFDDIILLEDLCRYINRYYLDWLKLRWAIADRLVVDENSYWDWSNNLNRQVNLGSWRHPFRDWQLLKRRWEIWTFEPLTEGISALLSNQEREVYLHGFSKPLYLLNAETETAPALPARAGGGE
jgi:hypothetical protein